MTLTLERTVIAAVIGPGNRIELRGPYNERLQEFYQSLPGAKWDKKRCCWTCHITQACCWRITSQAPCTVEAEEKIRAIGHRFYEPVLRPAEDRPVPVEALPSRKYQRAAFWFAYHREATLLDMWMGLGKSKVAVDLCMNWNCRRVIVICPVSVRGVWRREFEKHAPGQWSVCVLESGTTKHKAKAAQNAITLAEAQGQRVAIVVNYETAKLADFAVWSFTVEWDCAIGDESHRFKGHASQVSKYMAELALDAKRRLALSGTPMAHSPLDTFAQVRFLDRGIFGTSWHRHRTMFAVSGPFGADHIVGYKNQEELARRLSLVTFHAGAENLDLPAVQHIDIPFELGKEARRLYDEMENDLIAFVKNGGEVTAGNGLVKLLRLQQICSGFVEDDNEVVHEVGTEKRDTLADLLEDLNEPVVAFCVFHQQLDVIHHVAEALDRRPGEISGRRKDLTPNATMPDDIDLMATQIRSGGVGIDLTRARVAVYYAPCYSLGDYDQSLSRINRPGQTRPCVFYHLVGIDTVDQVIYRALDKKRDVINEVISYLKGDAA